MTIIEARPDSIHHRIEEWLNSATHGIGAVLSVIGTIALVVAAGQMGDAWKVVSFSIFGATLIMLYMASAFYHAAAAPDSGPSSRPWTTVRSSC